MSALAGTGALARLALRRDRVILPAWITVFVVMAAGSASATAGLYPTVASRVQAASDLNATPAMVALYGRVYDPTSLGALSLLKLSAIGAAMVGVLTLFVTIRHTRAEEEAGRLELLGATVVARHAPLTAALSVTTAASLVLGALSALGMIAAGLPVAGSLAFGLAWASTGIVFAAIAAVAAQLTEGARAARGISVAVVGLAFLLRAVGDSSGPRWLSWLSPIGWAQQLRPYAGDRWWVLALPAGFALAMAGLAYALAARRDFAAGLVPSRPGAAAAASWLREPFALAWRLQRGTLLGWLAAFVLIGAVFGNIAANIGGFMASVQARDFITKLGGQRQISDAFLAVELGMAGVMAAAYAVQAVLRLHAEETGNRAEVVLATAVGRLRWVTGHLLVALAGSAALLAGVGLAAGLTYGAARHDMGQVGPLLGAALVRLPAAWVLAGITAAVFGLVPRLATAGWVALAAFLLLGEFGPLFKLSQWVMDISPFTHVPRLPGGEMSVTPLLWLLAVAAALLAAGLAGFRRRDLVG